MPETPGLVTPPRRRDGTGRAEGASCPGGLAGPRCPRPSARPVKLRVVLGANRLKSVDAVVKNQRNRESCGCEHKVPFFFYFFLPMKFACFEENVTGLPEIRMAHKLFSESSWRKDSRVFFLSPHSKCLCS